MHWYNLSAFLCLNSTSLNTHAPHSQSWRFPSFLPLLLSFVSARQLSGSASAKAFKPARTNGHTHTIGQTFVLKKYNVRRILIQHPHVACLALSPRFHHPFFPTTASAHGSVLCNMPDGRDQEIRHWGEHMRLAHYPSRSPSSTLHTRLHMLRTASHFSATAVIMSHTHSRFLLFSPRLSLSEINSFTFLTNSVSYSLLLLNAQM